MKKRKSLSGKEWRNQRNGSIFRLHGLRGNLSQLITRNYRVLTESEIDRMSKIIDSLDELISNWKDNNEQSKEEATKERSS